MALHDGTERTVDGATYTLHDEPGCTLVRHDGALVGWWVHTDDRGRSGCAAFVLRPCTLPGGRTAQHQRRVGNYRTLPRMLAALHAARAAD
jgi:hypothetical protein